MKDSYPPNQEDSDEDTFPWPAPDAQEMSGDVDYEWNPEDVDTSGSVGSTAMMWFIIAVFLLGIFFIIWGIGASGLFSNPGRPIP